MIYSYLHSYPDHTDLNDFISWWLGRVETERQKQEPQRDSEKDRDTERETKRDRNQRDTARETHRKRETQRDTERRRKKRSLLTPAVVTQCSSFLKAFLPQEVHTVTQ